MKSDGGPPNPRTPFSAPAAALPSGSGDRRISGRGAATPLAVTKRAPSSSPRRQTRRQTRMMLPQGVNETPKSSGTASAPTFRHSPVSEMSRMKTSIQGASGASKMKPDRRYSMRGCLRRPRSLLSSQARISRRNIPPNPCAAISQTFEILSSAKYRNCRGETRSLALRSATAGHRIRMDRPI
jgi:hypothetical protein